MSKHTTGPWTHEGQGDITAIENDPANGCVGKVDVCSVYLRTVPGRHEANARLIAAAPDLLEALQALMENYETVGGLGFNMFAVTKACRAIDKATGENK